MCFLKKIQANCGDDTQWPVNLQTMDAEFYTLFLSKMNGNILRKKNYFFIFNASGQIYLGQTVYNSTFWGKST